MSHVYHLIIREGVLDFSENEAGLLFTIDLRETTLDEALDALENYFYEQGEVAKFVRARLYDEFDAEISITTVKEQSEEYITIKDFESSIPGLYIPYPYIPFLICMGKMPPILKPSLN